MSCLREKVELLRELRRLYEDGTTTANVAAAPQIPLGAPAPVAPAPQAAPLLPAGTSQRMARIRAKAKLAIDFAAKRLQTDKKIPRSK